MFALPETLEAQPFACLPDELRTGSVKSEWNSGQPAGLHATSFLEGPSFDRDGVLWCVDVVNGRILNIDQDGEFSVAVEYDGWPNGLKIREDGLVFIADYKNGIMVHEPGSKVVKPFLVRAGMERFKAVNDLFFAANGDLFFTDQGLTGLHDPTGRVFRITRDGKVDCLLSNVPSPNGLVMDHDEHALLLAVTRANAVWRVPILNGGVAKVGTFIQLSGGVGPDGLALDSSGGLLIAHAGMGAVWVFNARGEPTYRVNTAAGNLSTNLAFGGPENRDIFITESRSAQIYRARVEVPGKVLVSHRPAG
ncbi:gluconolactonase [Paraburkholderia sp. GV068]|uniref:SMP-30/gluconolactonase/LRE family protein n=1 Tax=unclassified Paraburkholderia TaxID=2615204 RepID=UPI000D30422D|nr:MULTISPECIES: SMP-30/gluconolactonase/LRE family protein [unclassified Paraburkholderia]PTQ93363.1 gluconolactonase [Paraburkholderia sp. GV072]PUB00010.1 gluconolactonase [Paraburkholderia sp. GV068]